MSIITKLQSIFFCLVFVTGLTADVPEKQAAEVEHLLYFVENSGCRMKRNNKSYDGKDAAAHINRKYDYFRNKISNTEEFVEYSATRSTVSGKYYEVICVNEDPVKTRDWLLQELARYRADPASG